MSSPDEARDREDASGPPASGWAGQHPLEPELVVIPAGEFWMGADPQRPEMARLGPLDLLAQELPYHQLSLPAYAIGRYPVTHAEYTCFIGQGGYRRQEFWTAAGWHMKENAGWSQPRYWTEETEQSLADYPVYGVNWYEAVAYCRWLSQRTGQLYRLATEAEWEKAARGPDGRVWPWGNTWLPDHCHNAERASDHPTPVTLYAPTGDSPYGVSDMAGNVWEWCATRFGKSYPYPLEDEWHPDYLEGTSLRALRGASRLFSRSFARCSRRDQNVPDYADTLIGFRVVTSDI